jgi:rfaE bifunctional protein kinase chain/domain
MLLLTTHNSQLTTSMSPEKLSTLFQNFTQLKVLIIGDVMLDSYIWGKVERISPESPVPIVSVQKKEMRPGGAANVAMNISAMGATPVLCSVVGKDQEAEILRILMKQFNMPLDGLLKSDKRKTTLKTRIMSGSHHHLRLDEEMTDEISENETKSFINLISNLLNSQKVDAIVFEDYDKGIINKALINEVTSLALRLSIPVIVDPKRKNFNFYQSVSLLKPNLAELKDGIRNNFEELSLESLNEAVDHLLEKQNINAALVTLSDRGIYLNCKGIKKIFPAQLRKISDVSGAGDTVVCIAALCEALKSDPELMAQLCNLAGGIVCEQAGVVPIDKARLLREAIQLFSKL